MAYISFKPQDYFNTSSQWSGNDSTQTISGVGLQPDLTWAKAINDTTPWGSLDSVRGSTKWIRQNDTTAEQTKSDGITAFNSDGFAIGANGYINDSNYVYRSWNWKAGTTSGISGGTLTPTAYSINTTSGIGIYHYSCTGANATIAHGLSSAPKMILTKSLGDTSPWAVWHTAMNPTNYLVLNDTAAQATGAAMWNSTAPSSTLISLGTDGQTNGTGKNNIMYAFADVKGYSKMGMYEGTGSSSATPYIWTGFRPAWIMIKAYNNVHNFAMYDDKRLGQNATSNKGNATMCPNLTQVEQKDDDIDIFANGFRPRITSNQVNGSSWLYMYAAFASNPMVGSNGNAALGR